MHVQERLKRVLNKFQVICNMRLVVQLHWCVIHIKIMMNYSKYSSKLHLMFSKLHIICKLYRVLMLLPFTICNMLKLIEILLRMSNHLAVLEVSLTGHIHITISRAIQFDFMFPQKYSRLKKDFNRFVESFV